jgi:hypothetical protein
MRSDIASTGESEMRFSLAQFFGMVTLITVMFAGLRMLLGDPEAIGAAIILALPVHTIVCEMVDRMSNVGRM